MALSCLQAAPSGVGQEVLSVTQAQVIPLPRRQNGVEPYLSKKQLAACLGFSERWVDYRVDEGMPVHRFSKRRRFRLSEVEAWLEER